MYTTSNYMMAIWLIPWSDPLSGGPGTGGTARLASQVGGNCCPLPGWETQRLPRALRRRCQKEVHQPHEAHMARGQQSQVSCHAHPDQNPPRRCRWRLWACRGEHIQILNSFCSRWMRYWKLIIRLCFSCANPKWRYWKWKPLTQVLCTARGLPKWSTTKFSSKLFVIAKRKTVLYIRDYTIKILTLLIIALNFTSFHWKLHILSKIFATDNKIEVSWIPSKAQHDRRAI